MDKCEGCPFDEPEEVFSPCDTHGVDSRIEHGCERIDDCHLTDLDKHIIEAMLNGKAFHYETGTQVGVAIQKQPRAKSCHEGTVKETGEMSDKRWIQQLGPRHEGDDKPCPNVLKWGTGGHDG